MNAFKRASLKLSHAVKHKTLSGGSTEEIVDEALEKRLSEHKAYEEKVKTLQALTLDARAQLGEVFLQIGNAAQCVEQLSDHQLDPASARATLGLPPEPGDDPKADEQTFLMLLEIADKAKVVGGAMQEAFHGAFGEGLQNALLAPLEQETQAFKDTAKKLEDQHRTAMEARHYREQIVAMNAGKTKNDPEKLARNAGKSAEAERAAADAKKALEDAFAAHDAARLDICCKRVGHLKGMLHRFCELVLTALSMDASMVKLTKGKTELDASNVYGDVNVMSIADRLKKGMGLTERTTPPKRHLKLAHYKAHARTAFTTGKQSGEDKPVDAEEREVDEMTLRFNQSTEQLQNLLKTTEDVAKWYESGFRGMVAVAGELPAFASDSDPSERTAAVLTFHATLEEVSAALAEQFLGPFQSSVIEPLKQGLEEYRDTTQMLQDRKAKKMERDHYQAKLENLEREKVEKDSLEKTTPKQKQELADRLTRNRTKAFETAEDAKQATKAVRDRLRAYSKFARGQCQAVGDALVPLQRDFYVAFAEKVVKGLALDPDATPVDQRAADKLKDLMARGLAVPNAGMTTDRGAAAAFQMRQPTGPPKTPEESLAGKAPLSAGETERVRDFMVAETSKPPDQLPPAPLPPPATEEKVLPPGMMEVVGTFDFAADQPGDLGFKAGDVILTDAAAFAAAGDSGGWVSGELNGKQGSFPSNYCAPK